jgi:hypothetical protein
MLTTDPNLDYIRVAFVFAGALLGGVLDTPIIELFKDRLGESRRWNTQKADIISSLRLVMGILDAIEEVKAEAFGVLYSGASSYPNNVPKYSKSAFSRLKNFNFKLIDESIQKLSAVHPKESTKSAVSQRMVQYLLVIRGHLDEVKKVSPQNVQFSGSSFVLDPDDNDVLKSYDKISRGFHIYVSGVYADTMGITKTSIILDKKVFLHDIGTELMLASEHLSELDRKRESILNRFPQEYAETSSARAEEAKPSSNVKHTD